MLQTNKQKKVKNNVHLFEKSSDVCDANVFFLKIFFYVPHQKRENLETLIHFFQESFITVEKINNKNSVGPLSLVLKTANFVARSHHLLSRKEFDSLNQFLISNVILVAFFYHNQIWTHSRLEKLRENFPLVPYFLKTPSVWKNQSQVFWKKTRTLGL